MNGYFEHYIESDWFRLKYAKGEPSTKGQEFHNYHEFVLFLGGKSHLISKNIQKELKIGSLVIVPKACFHQFAVSGSNYTRLIVGFRETEEIATLCENVMSEVKVIESPDKALISSLNALIEITKSNLSQKEKELFHDLVIDLARERNQVLFIERDAEKISVRNFGTVIEFCEKMKTPTDLDEMSEKCTFLKNFKIDSSYNVGVYRKNEKSSFEQISFDNEKKTDDQIFAAMEWFFRFSNIQQCQWYRPYNTYFYKKP